jgi:hypothetical protein
VKHYSPGEIMNDRCLHVNDLQLAFGIYCQEAENVEPRHSLAPRMRVAILLGNSGNLSGGQLFFALDSGQTIVRHQWVVLPVPSAVIDDANLLGINEPSILTFTNRHGHDIVDLAQDFEPCANEDEDSFVTHPNDELTGVDVHSGDDELPGVDTDFDTKPTGVEVDTEAYGDVLQEQNKVYGLRQQDHIVAPTEMPSAEPTAEPFAAPQGSSSPAKRRSTQMVKKPSAYTPSMTGNKYAVALTQIVTSLQGSKNAVSVAQMSVKLMLPGVHRKADTVGMIMAQLSMKASIKKLGAEAQYTITKEMKQLHWCNSYKPKHWHGLTKKQKEQVLESHIFVEQKKDGRIKAQKVIRGNKQRDYITKEYASSPTVSAEAVMLA